MIKNIISKCADVLASVLFPLYCFICKTEGASLCTVCLSRFAKSFDTPAPYITSLYTFKDPHLKKIIHAIKYFHRKDLLVPFALDLAEEIQKDTQYSSYTVVPIPMPRLRIYMRGYNHCEALAKEISKKISLPTQNDILLRNKSKAKKRQVTMHSRSERLKNQHNSFIVNKDVAGMNIILIDDVVTTGATLHEARKVLLEHGAARVQAFTIAH